MPAERETFINISKIRIFKTKPFSVFHPDMVWPWPKTAQSHDPIDWTLKQGRFNYDRWKKGWQELFDNHELIHNKREIKKIVISKEDDGAFAVVDIDTLWINHEGKRH